MERYKKLIILFSVLTAGIITISLIFALKADDDKKNTGNHKDGVKDVIQPDETEIKGSLMMLVGIDLDSSQIRAIELDSGIEHALTFTGGSDIRTGKLKTISAAYLKKGNVARIDFDDDGRISSLTGAGEVWSYKNISRIKIDEDTGRIQLGSSVYRLGQNYRVLSDDDFVSLDSIVMNGTDMIDIYGIENSVHLIKVVSGHGYLTLANYEDFIDGSLYYGMGKCTEVTDGLKLMLPEGEQEITVQKDGQTANAVVRIVKDEETCFDLEGFGPEPLEYKTVTFNISPEGSLLYIDGVKTLYNEPVSLTPGFHQIEVELGGYMGYKGSIEVEKDGLVKNISLSPVPTEIPDDVIYDSFSEDDEDENGSQSSTYGTPAPDNADLGNDTWNEPDNTSVGNDDENIEVLDGDKTENGRESANDNRNTGNSSDKISIVGDLDDDDEDDPRDTKRYSGEMTIYCSEGTEIYIDDVYKGRVTGGSLTTPKPVGTIELKLVKSGYVTKKYTLTMDEEEDSSIFKFPDMTPEGR